MIVAGLQVWCITLCSIGIVIELITGANMGFILITVGSLIFAISTKFEAAKGSRKDLK